MKILFFSIHDFERDYLAKYFLHEQGIKDQEATFLDTKLCLETVKLAKGYRAVSIFVHDHVDKKMAEELRNYGVENSSLAIFL